MNDNEFGGRIAHHLQSGLDSMDEATSARLKNARMAALAAYQHAYEQHSATRGLIWAGTLGERFRGLAPHRSLTWAPIVAALLALCVSVFMQSQQETDDVDALLLAGDLPIQAYIDKDFDAWLKSYSR